MTHSAILAFGQTENKEFPLILVVGREPNNVSSSHIDGVTTYEFVTKDQRQCAFWNTSFSLIGLPNGLRSSKMKELFIANNSSPILFTDASPKGIKNSVSNKNAIRETVTKDEIEEHVNAIFANEKFISRIKLVLFSGLDDGKYQIFKDLFKVKSSYKNIPIREISFLIGYNSKKIQSQIDYNDIKLFKQIFEQFNAAK